MSEIKSEGESCQNMDVDSLPVVQNPPLDVISQVLSETDYKQYLWTRPEGCAAGEGIDHRDVKNFPSIRNSKAAHCIMCGKADVHIPKQNKNICKTCDSSFWLYVKLERVIKYCKGCKNFVFLQDFTDKPEGTKCEKCRERERELYQARRRRKLRLAKASALLDKNRTPNDATTSGGQARAGGREGIGETEEREGTALHVPTRKAKRVSPPDSTPLSSVSQQVSPEFDPFPSLSTLSAGQRLRSSLSAEYQKNYERLTSSSVLGRLGATELKTKGRGSGSKPPLHKRPRHSSTASGPLTALFLSPGERTQMSHQSSVVTPAPGQLPVPQFDQTPMTLPSTGSVHSVTPEVEGKEGKENDKRKGQMETQREEAARAAQWQWDPEANPLMQLATILTATSHPSPVIDRHSDQHK